MSKHTSMYESDPWLRRRPGAGQGMVVAAEVPQRQGQRGENEQQQQQAGAESVALCKRFEGLLLPGLVAVSGRQSGVAGVCIWRNEQGQFPFEATLTTTRNSSPRGVGAMFEVWRNEVRANGSDSFIEAGESGGRTLRYCRGDSCEWLIEDHGVLLWLRAFRMSDVMFDEVARAATAKLREPAQPQ